MPSVQRIVRHIKKANTYDVAVILDCGNLSRIGDASETIKKIPVIINIDHHVTNTGFGDIQLIDPLACSTAEIVYRLIKALDVPIDKAIATSIYTGILTDTGSFRFSNTNQAAFAISKEMAELGVDPHDVAQHVYGTYSLGRIKLLNLALDSIEISDNGKLSVMTVTDAMLEETRTQAEDVDGLINYARRIEDVKVAALIQEQKNGKTNSTSQCRYHVSLRSDGTVDVAAIAGSFGIGNALIETGAAQYAAGGMTAVAGNNPLAALAIVYGVTMMMSAVITNNATAVIVFPIAVATAAQLGVDYMPFVMAIMLAASASFATPLGYQTNLMVYGPGGYSFRDFFRFGLPLSLLIWGMAVWLMPLVWPFHPVGG